MTKIKQHQNVLKELLQSELALSPDQRSAIQAGLCALDEYRNYRRKASRYKRMFTVKNSELAELKSKMK